MSFTFEVSHVAQQGEPPELGLGRDPLIGGEGPPSAGPYLAQSRSQHVAPVGSLARRNAAPETKSSHRIGNCPKSPVITSKSTAIHRGHLPSAEAIVQTKAARSKRMVMVMSPVYPAGGAL